MQFKFQYNLIMAFSKYLFWETYNRARLHGYLSGSIYILYTPLTDRLTLHGTLTTIAAASHALAGECRERVA